MSGFEIAGLVLGAIPLLISGLERYSESAEVLQNVKNYRSAFEDINSSFQLSVGIFTQSCYRLLAPLNLPDSEMKALLKETDREKVRQAWKDVDLERQLAKRLGPKYRAYLSFVDKLHRRMLKLAHKLKLGPDFQPPWVSRDGTIDLKARDKFFSNSWTRLVGGFETNKCANLLRDIDHDIFKIAQFTDVTVEMEPLQLGRRPRIASTFWKDMRESARSLSEALRLAWTVPCSCREPHQVSLQLKPYTDHHAHEDGGSDQHRFSLLFVVAPHRKWQEVEIQSSSTHVRSVNNPMIIQSCPSTPHSSAAKTSTGVRFNIPPIPAQSQSATTSASTSQASRIHGLCKVLASGGPLNHCIGYLEDHDRRHHIFLMPGLGAPDQIASGTSLHHLILETGQMILGPKEKCTIAYVLASAVLHLYDTPWLLTGWSLRNISLLRDNNGNHLRDRAYVTLITSPGSGPNPPNPAYRRRPIKNEVVFALGVALLELSHLKSLVDLTVPEDLDDYGNRDSMTDYFTADRLARAVECRELPNYAKAVLRCVHCNFDSSSYDLCEQDFRERFYEGVVVPLKEDWEYATHV